MIACALDQSSTRSTMRMRRGGLRAAQRLARRTDGHRTHDAIVQGDDDGETSALGTRVPRRSIQVP